MTSHQVVVHRAADRALFRFAVVEAVQQVNATLVPSLRMVVMVTVCPSALLYGFSMMASSNIMQASPLRYFLTKGFTVGQSSFPPGLPPDMCRVILSWKTWPSSIEVSPVAVTWPKLLRR